MPWLSSSSIQTQNLYIDNLSAYEPNVMPRTVYGLLQPCAHSALGGSGWFDWIDIDLTTINGNIPPVFAWSANATNSNGWGGNTFAPRNSLLPASTDSRSLAYFKVYIPTITFLLKGSGGTSTINMWLRNDLSQSIQVFGQSAVPASNTNYTIGGTYIMAAHFNGGYIKFEVQNAHATITCTVLFPTSLTTGNQVFPSWGCECIGYDP